jgi:dTDP-4-amino-4,6-dideoxygalactose transaminase
MASNRNRDGMMYVPAWQGLTLRRLTAGPLDAPAPFPLRHRRGRGFHTARSAIYQLFKRLVASGRTGVLAPDYHMGNELRAIRAAGARVELYPIDRDGRPDLGALAQRAARGADVLFTIHYAGWPQPVGELRALCDRYGLLLVEDCALALLSETEGRPLGSFGDYAVFCLYKSLPVLDGGLLVQNRHAFAELDHLPMRRIGRAFEIGQALELWVERVRSRTPRVGTALARGKRRIGALLTALRVKRVPVGDIGFNVTDTDLAMSNVSERLLDRLDYAAIAQQRRRNFSLLAELLADAGIVPWRELEPGVCPLFFPLLVKDKPEASRRLRESGVMATELWNEGDPLSAALEGPAARFLRRHLLELPVHQDVEEPQIRYMATKVEEARIALEETAVRSSPRPAGDRRVQTGPEPVASSR